MKGEDSKTGVKQYWVCLQQHADSFCKPRISAEHAACTPSQSSLEAGDLGAMQDLGLAACFTDSRVSAGGMVPFSLILEVAWSNKTPKSALRGCTETLMLIRE